MFSTSSQEKSCPDCGQAMDKGYITARGYWSTDKSTIKITLNRNFDKFKVSKTIAWNCPHCQLVIFRY